MVCRGCKTYAWPDRQIPPSAVLVRRHGQRFGGCVERSLACAHHHLVPLVGVSSHRVPDIIVSANWNLSRRYAAAQMKHATRRRGEVTQYLQLPVVSRATRRYTMCPTI
jgi:hypothetical protein